MPMFNRLHIESSTVFSTIVLTKRVQHNNHNDGVAFPTDEHASGKRGARVCECEWVCVRRSTFVNVTTLSFVFDCCCCFCSPLLIVCCSATLVHSTDSFARSISVRHIKWSHRISAGARAPPFVCMVCCSCVCVCACMCKFAKQKQKIKFIFRRRNLQFSFWKFIQFSCEWLGDVRPPPNTYWVVRTINEIRQP